MKERKNERKKEKWIKCEERCLSIFLHDARTMTGKRERDEEPKQFSLPLFTVRTYTFIPSRYFPPPYLLHFLTFVALKVCFPFYVFFCLLKTIFRVCFFLLMHFVLISSLSFCLSFYLH
jgi:hypothetical protein